MVALRTSGMLAASGPELYSTSFRSLALYRHQHPRPPFASRSVVISLYFYVSMVPETVPSFSHRGCSLKSEAASLRLVLCVIAAPTHRLQHSGETMYMYISLPHDLQIQIWSPGQYLPQSDEIINSSGSVCVWDHVYTVAVELQ
jgi:hypothetical protein